MISVYVWLVVKDFPRRARWQSLLARGGWPVSPTDMNGLMREAKSNKVGLALIDWESLGRPPASAVQALKACAAPCSIILTSCEKIADDEVIEALSVGADDFLPETLDGRLILAKLNAHLRRLLPSLAKALDVLRAPGGDLKLDRSRREVSVRGGRGKWLPIAGITPTEFQLLALFLERPGTILEREFLLDLIWRGQADSVRPGTIDKHVESLRRKLGTLGSRIQTVYGSGYAFKEGPGDEKGA